MRILFLAKQLPGPVADGYDVRNRGLLGRLGRLHDVDVLSYDSGEMPDAIEALVRSCTTVEPPPKRKAPLPRRFAEFLSEKSLYVRSEAFAAAVRDALTKTDYDLVWVAGWVMHQYVPDVRAVAGPATKIVGDPADDEVRASRIELKKARGLRDRIWAWRTLVRNERFQEKYLTDVEVLLFVSSADADATRERLKGRSIEVSQNGVDTDAFAPAETPTDDPVLVFEGTMSFAPNVEGAVHFVRDVLPLVRAEIPDARALLVGRSPSPEVQALASDAVEVTGTVDDVREAVLRGSVFVCPLLGGTGQKNKILQAWSMAIPIVATSISVPGLAFEDGQNIVLADGAQAFADACVRLLRDPAERARLGAAGRRTALDVYSVERKMDEVEALVERLVPTSAATSEDRTSA